MSVPPPVGKFCRFNPPPNWPPPPPGWTPPQGWVPDPSWPPPPDGWQLWMEAPTAGGTEQGTGPGVAAGRSRGLPRWVIIGGAVVVGLIIANVTPGVLGHVLALIVWVAAAWSCVRPARARTASAARTWARVGVAAFTCLGVYAGSLAVVGGVASPNWYANGKAFVLRDNKVDTAKLIGLPGIVQKWCTGVLDAGSAPVPTGPLPSTADGSAVAQWVSGCVDGYAKSHPDDPDGTTGTIWDTNPSTGGTTSPSSAAPAPASPSPSYTPLSLTCTLQYWIPGAAPFTFGAASATGWQPITGPQNPFGGDSPAPAGWPNTQALSGSLPAGWKQGAHVVITDSATPPPQPAGGYRVIVTFQDAGGKTIYATSVSATLQPPQGYETQPPGQIDVSAGVSATGATQCTATVPSAE